jgi:hypothetical protein
MTRAEQVAWAAGLFEGEGCFTMTARKRTPRASMYMTDEETVRRFHAIMGVGSVTATNPPSRPAHHKPQWMWCANGKDVETVLCLLRPFLSSRRLERGEEIVRERESLIAESTRLRDCRKCGRAFRPPYTTRSNTQVFCSAECRVLFHARRPKRNGRRLPLTGTDG